MDDRRFDELTRIFGVALNRKRFLAFVAGVVAPVAAVDSLEGVDAKKGKGGKGKGKGKGGVGGQGGDNPVCAALCSGDVPDPRFCGSFGDCGSDADCIDDPNGPICCTTSPGCGGAGEGACCSAPGNGACGDPCSEDGDCGECPNAKCIDVAGRRRPGAEGADRVCASQCTDSCLGDCSLLGDDCFCFGQNGDSGCYCTEGCRCEGGCLGKKKKVECPDPEFVPDCVCDADRQECTICPGSCTSNDACQDRGADSCVCFLGVDTASAELVAEVSAQGEGGECGECLGLGDRECVASSECCGQLVCDGGECRQKRKPDPEPRCAKHGQNCRKDRDCCAQGSCYRGKCGEKDTHCHHDRECARGYRCQGGDQSAGHKRCRKNGSRKRHKRK